MKYSDHRVLGEMVHRRESKWILICHLSLRPSRGGKEFLSVKNNALFSLSSFQTQNDLDSTSESEDQISHPGLDMGGIPF